MEFVRRHRNKSLLHLTREMLAVFGILSAVTVSFEAYEFLRHHHLYFPRGFVYGTAILGVAGVVNSRLSQMEQNESVDSSRQTNNEILAQDIYSSQSLLLNKFNSLDQLSVSDKDAIQHACSTHGILV